MIILKICVIHGELTKKDVIKNTNRKNSFRCKKCKNIEAKKYYSKNKEALLEKQKMWKRNNKKKTNEMTKRWKIKNKKRADEIRRKCQKKQVKILSDCYVKKIMKRQNIPSKLIEVKKSQLKLKRKLKEIRDERQS